MQLTLSSHAVGVADIAAREGSPHKLMCCIRLVFIKWSSPTAADIHVVPNRRNTESAGVSIYAIYKPYRAVANGSGLKNLRHKVETPRRQLRCYSSLPAT